ncbi:hypothetical protein HMI54_009997, partial [Coelomomyces lativittatus]
MTISSSFSSSLKSNSQLTPSSSLVVSKQLITPITALGYLNESFVLIGIGSTIYIWDVALDHLHPLHGVLESPFQWISAYHVYGFLVVHTTEPLTKSCLERGWNGKIGVYG